MQGWEWILAGLGGLSALFVFGANIWGVFDVLRDERLDTASRGIWTLVILLAPLFGIVAWLYAKPRLDGPNFRKRFR